MKRLLSLLALVVFFLTSCQEEDQISTKEDIRFTLDVARGDGLASTDFPDNINVDITLASPNGQTVIKNIPFTGNAEAYTSAPVEMLSGEYKLSDFVIVNENLAAIPGLIDDFSVHKNAKNVSLGHAALQSKGARPMLIAVYAEEKGKMKFTDAKASIYSDEGEYYEYNLLAKPNHIAFKGNPDASYTLKIEKEGYEVCTKTFIYKQLKKKRLEISLQEKSIEPELAVTIQPSATYFSMWLGFTGKGAIVLDWGNGETEVIDFDVDPDNETGTGFAVRDQTYATSIPLAKITGDIHLLTYFFSESAMDALDLKYATQFQRLELWDGELPILDLSANHELTSLMFTNANIGKLVLPEQHWVSEFMINSGTEWPSMSQLDYIIDNIHANAVAANINDGGILLNNMTVSAQSASKLLELQDTYGWRVEY